jgi:hypothetical protein
MSSLSYTLNGGTAQPLEMGENQYRLSSPGDFNAEIPYSSLSSGQNTVVLTAIDQAGLTSSQTVTLTDAYTGQSWPGNYGINWATAPNISSVAQVVEGNWAIQPNGTVRTLSPGYDRLIDLGDMSSWVDYQATVEVTINALPANGGSFGIGPIFGWQGHTPSGDAQQPSDGHPFDAWFNYADNGPNLPNSLSIYANSPNHHESTLATDPSGMQLSAGTTYEFKMQATTNVGGTTSNYAFKVWPKGATEPTNWLVQATGDHNQGSLLLASYWADVSYGAVTVTSLSPPPSQPVAPGTVLGSWTVVQSSQVVANAPNQPSETVTATLPAATTAGDQVLLVLAGSTSGTPTPTVTPGTGIVALGGVSGPSQSGKYNPLVKAFVANAVSAGQTAFSLSVTGGPTWGDYETLLAIELSGPSIGLDKIATTTATGPTTTMTAGPITTSTSNELTVTAASWDANPTSATGPSASTPVTSGITNAQPFAAWLQSVPTSGTNVSSTVSWSPAGSYDSSLAVLTLR